MQKKKERSVGSRNFRAMLRKYFTKQQAVLLPNVLCYLRVVLVLAFLALYLTPYEINGNPYSYVYVSTAVMALSAYTDFLDGFIARKFDLSSPMGQVVDPLADKISQGVIGVAIVVKFHAFPSILITLVLFLVKELGMLLAVIDLARHGKNFGGAKWYGKVATFLLYVAFGTILIFGPFVLVHYQGRVGMQHVILDTISSVGIFGLLLATVGYTVQYVRLKQEIRKEAKEKTEKKEEVHHD